MTVLEMMTTDDAAPAGVETMRMVWRVAFEPTGEFKGGGGAPVSYDNLVRNYWSVAEVDLPTLAGNVRMTMFYRLKDGYHKRDENVWANRLLGQNSTSFIKPTLDRQRFLPFQVSTDEVKGKKSTPPVCFITREARWPMLRVMTEASSLRAWCKAHVGVHEIWYDFDQPDARREYVEVAFEQAKDWLVAKMYWQDHLRDPA